MTIRGSVIAPISTAAMLPAFGLRYVAKKGRQKPDGFVGGAASALEASLDGGAFEHAGLTLEASILNEEPLEVNAGFSETCAQPQSSASHTQGRRRGRRRLIVRHGRVCASAVQAKKASCPNKQGRAHAGAAAVARCKKITA